MGDVIRGQALSSKYDGGDYIRNIRIEIGRIFLDWFGKHQGIITVIDAFVKYNTMRGNDYVTAKEFIQAAEKVAEVQPEIVMETLTSGVKVLRLRNLSRKLL